MGKEKDNLKYIEEKRLICSGDVRRKNVKREAKIGQREWINSIDILIKYFEG